MPQSTLEANTASNAPINVLARESVGSKRVHNDEPSLVQEPEVAYTVGTAPGCLI